MSYSSIIGVDMGDMGEMYSDMKEHSKNKRAGNRENAVIILKHEEIEFESKNIGAHLIVQGIGGIIDFWPGTGKYVTRCGTYSGRGIRNLIKIAK